MGKKYSILFDSYHLYHLPQFEPLIKLLSDDERFDIYHSTSREIDKEEYDWRGKEKRWRGGGEGGKEQKNESTHRSGPKTRGRSAPTLRNPQKPSKTLWKQVNPATQHTRESYN